MNIAMFSINPLFPDKVNGGSPKHLQNIAVHLGELGHEVTILSTQREDSSTPFNNWHPNVWVKPLLKHKQPFPQPYEIPHYQLAYNIQLIGELLEKSDRLYIHDGELLFPPVYQDIPTTISLRDNAYPETMLGSYLFQGDALVPISNYSERLYLNTAGRLTPGLAARTRTINNGLDWEMFRPTPPSKEILDIIGFDPRDYNIVLHPHRPEPSKGLFQTVEVVDLLVNEYKIPNLRVLVPRWFEADISTDVREYYEGIEREIEARGIKENFVFHGWMPQRLMPEYFSLGGVMLALGHFVEAFGNAVYESLGCGTPSVVARVATYRDILPDDLHDKVHFNDAQHAAEIAARILTNKERTRPETLTYLHEHYTIEKQLNAFADTILNAEKLPPLAYQHETLTEQTLYKLAPWCYEWDDARFFHDFSATHARLEDLSRLLKQSEIFNTQHVLQAGIDAKKITDWYEAGYIVPFTQTPSG